MAGELGDSEQIECRQCRHSVPRLEFCVRCGHSLAEEYHGERLRRGGTYAAAPNESVRSLALISTLFPELPRADMRVFRLCFAAGVALLIGLGLLGLFPVALVTAAVLVPFLMVLYLWTVDTYEDEPRPVIGATMVWGALAGVVSALIASRLPAPIGLGGLDVAALAASGVVMPLVDLLLMLIGPLLLLPWRRFNDALDGAIFGAASAISFGGARLLVIAVPMLGAGLRPGGDPLQWTIQLLSLGVLLPVIAAGSLGALCGTLWLRFRAPVADRHALGYSGSPAVAAVAAASLLVLAGLTRAGLPPVPQAVVLVVLAIAALFWLRTMIHFGLLQEAREIDIGAPMTCPNCGRETPVHTFCGNCGVAMRALPRPSHPPVESAPAAGSPTS